jgi:hypothetical protein
MGTRDYTKVLACKESGTKSAAWGRFSWSNSQGRFGKALHVFHSKVLGA